MSGIKNVSFQKETRYRIYTFWCNATFHNGKTTSLVKGSVTSSNEQSAFMLFEDRLRNLGWEIIHRPVDMIVTDNPF